MKHVMVDLETFGNGHDAAIASIGAVLFDLETGKLGEQFYEVVDLAGSVSPGVIDPSTVYWWLKQSEAARTALLTPTNTLDGALVAFRSFVEGAEFLWSNGPMFDERILREAWQRHDGIGTFPFHHRGSRCCRTYYALAKRLGVTLNDGDFGVAHNALADAMKQAHHMGQIHARVVS